MELELQIWHCTGRTLFKPVNKTAKDLCEAMGRRNLSEKEVQFFADNCKVTLKPLLTMRKGLLKHVDTQAFAE
jgi:hypothetical protein